MVGERTWTSAMSGAATNTVAAGPGSLSAVPLLTSSVERRRLGRHDLALAERPARRAAASPTGAAAGGAGRAAAGSAPAPAAGRRRRRRRLGELRRRAPAAATVRTSDWPTPTSGVERGAHDRRARRNGGDGRRQRLDGGLPSAGFAAGLPSATPRQRAAAAQRRRDSSCARRCWRARTRDG